MAARAVSPLGSRARGKPTSTPPTRRTSPTRFSRTTRGARRRCQAMASSGVTSQGCRGGPATAGIGVS